MNSDLELVATDDLIQELKKRFDHLVIVSCKKLNKPDAEYVFGRQIQGDPWICRSMLAHASFVFDVDIYRKIESNPIDREDI